MNDQEFTHSDIWKLRGEKCLIEIAHHTKYDDRHGWCLYIYLYPGHLLFPVIAAQASKPYYDIKEISSMPLHGGCTYFRAHINEKAGDICSVQIGCDYSHLHDEHYETYDGKHGIDVAIAQDARDLLEYVSLKKAEEVRP